MTEKHYAHLAPNYIADTIRESFPRLLGDNDRHSYRLTLIGSEPPTRPL
jgi:hypothetical protein